MSQKTVSILLLLLVIAGVSHAQTTPPPLPGALFDESVTIVAVHPVIDNTNHTLSIYQDDDWLTLPYPDGLTNIAILRSYASDDVFPRITRRPDGTYIFLQQLDQYTFETWIADPEAERLYPVDPPCETTEFSFGNPWVYQNDGADTYLCNWITGETSPRLPERLAWGAADYGVDQPNFSPDGRYLVLMSYFQSNNHRYGKRVYSYEVETQRFRFMGEIVGFFDIIDFSDWLTPSIFVMGATDMPEWSIRNQYVGDVTETNSLEFAISGLRFSPRMVYDPPGLQAMDADMEDGPTPGPCFVRFYDATTRHLSQYDTGALCEYGIPIPDGSGDQLYRAIYPNAVVVRYNYYTGTRRNLFMGEVETLGPVAPDGRRGLIALGNNGIVDTDQDPDLNFGTFLEPTEYVIMDLNDGSIFGRVPADAQWLTSSYLYDVDRLFTAGKGGVLTTELPGEMLLARPDQAQLLLQTPENELILYDSASNSVRPIAAIPAGYHVTATHLYDDVTRLKLYSPEGEQPVFMFDVLLP